MKANGESCRSRFGDIVAYNSMVTKVNRLGNLVYGQKVLCTLTVLKSNIIFTTQYNSFNFDSNEYFLKVRYNSL